MRNDLSYLSLHQYSASFLWIRLLTIFDEVNKFQSGTDKKLLII